MKHFFSLLLFLSVSIFTMGAEKVILSVGYIDPTNNQEKPHKSPIHVPQITIEDREVTFLTPCIGCEMRIVDGAGNIIFSTTITSDKQVLPDYLIGNYVIQIIRSDVYFYGFIDI